METNVVPGFRQLFDQPGGVAVQHVPGARLDMHRRELGEVGVEDRGEWAPRVLIVEVQPRH